MKADSAPASVADYCGHMIDNKITVNRDYQRDDRIWSPYIRSYFIESILLGYPIPKLFLYVRYDLRTKTSYKEIVDGQQRSQALRMFYENRTKLSTRIDSPHLRGKKYRDLEPEDQAKFLSYSLPIDEFRGVGEDEIRESFARMNVHNISLNSEELRNAKFQGSFKLFILQLTKAFREPLVAASILSRRDIVRMADCRLFSDISIILDEGFETTKSGNIDTLYKKYDIEFPFEGLWKDQIIAAINEWRIQTYEQFDEFRAKHIFYTFIAAIIEVMHPGSISNLLSGDQRARYDRILAEDCSLERLSEDIRGAKEARVLGDDPDLAFPQFVSACSVKTNVGDEKFVRFAYLVSSLI